MVISCLATFVYNLLAWEFENISLGMSLPIPILSAFTVSAPPFLVSVLFTNFPQVIILAKNASVILSGHGKSRPLCPGFGLRGKHLKSHH